MYRQGDVLIKKVKELPKKSKKLETDIIVLGEATGHAHRIVNGTIYRSNRNVRYIKANKGAELIHDEHGPIKIEPGIYEIVIQREFDPRFGPDGVQEVID